MERNERGRRRNPASVQRMRTLGDYGGKEYVRDDVRASIAHAAASLIASGLTDYHAAKLKAARRLGVSDKKSLPDNHEIEVALREHLALFQRDSQPRALSALRETALSAMRRLETFSPWLTGAVLAGTANEFSDIELELIGVDAKSFELYLINAGVDFELREPVRTRGRDEPERLPQYRCEYEGLPLAITLYDSQSQRQAMHPRASLRHERAQLAEAERKFAAEEKAFDTDKV